MVAGVLAGLLGATLLWATPVIAARHCDAVNAACSTEAIVALAAGHHRSCCSKRLPTLIPSVPRSYELAVAETDRVGAVSAGYRDTAVPRHDRAPPPLVHTQIAE
jgi:hypothetical protein